MPNSTTTNPIFLDTFSSDIVIFSGMIPVKSIVFKSTNVDDELVLEDKNGIEVLRLSVHTANKTVSWTPASTIYFNSLVLDVSEGKYEGTCKAFIYT